MQRFLFAIFIFAAVQTKAQDVLVSGSILDSTGKLTISSVKVMSNRGAVTYSDSVGHYNLLVFSDDSVHFTFRNKTTVWFPVKDMKYSSQFDIALKIRIQDRYQTLKEVVVIKKSYRQDSLENRQKYSKIFNGSTGGLRLTESSMLGGGTPGLDPNEIINMFRFRRNRNLRNLQKRLLDEEAKKFIDYRFNKNLVKRISGLESPDLETFMRVWRPTYDLCAGAEEYDFHYFILEASKLFKKGVVPTALPQ
jgi:hypothetical protein